MAYEKHTWVCGETITAEKLNNIEEGIEEALACCGGGTEPLETVLGFNSDCSKVELDKTLQDFSDAKENRAEVNLTLGEEFVQAYGITKATYMQTFEAQNGERAYPKNALLSKSDEEWVEIFREQDGTPITTNNGQVLIMVVANGERTPFWLYASAKNEKPGMAIESIPIG